MKKLAAVFTIVKNEKVFLPIWLKYYSKYFPMEDIYVLDHQSTDGSTLDLPCNVKVVKNPKAFDGLWMLDVVKTFQQELLEKYEYVVFAEGDELLVTLEQPGHDLYDHIQTMKDRGKNFDVAVGYELMQNTITENTYDPSKPILDQRRHWYRNPLYDKTLIANLPLDWVAGYHSCQFKVTPNSKLILLHLHRFDFQHYMKRKLKITNYDIADPWKPGVDFQQRFTKAKEMRDFFYKSEDLLQQIPKDFPVLT